jgi:hypothetical protein
LATSTDYGSLVEGDEVEFAEITREVADEDAIAELLQELRRGAFGTRAEPASPPGVGGGGHGS